MGGRQQKRWYEIKEDLCCSITVANQKLDITYMFIREMLKSIIDYLYMVNPTEPVREKNSGKREKGVQYKLVKNQSGEECE